MEKKESEFTSEDFEKEQESDIKDGWKEFEEKPGVKKEGKKLDSFETLREEYVILSTEWTQVAMKYDRYIKTSLFNLFGKEGLTGIGRMVTDEFSLPDYNEIPEAKKAVDFVVNSRRLWMDFGRRHRDYVKVIQGLFELSKNNLIFIQKLQEANARLKGSKIKVVEYKTFSDKDRERIEKLKELIPKMQEVGKEVSYRNLAEEYNNTYSDDRLSRSHRALEYVMKNYDKETKKPDLESNNDR